MRVDMMSGWVEVLAAVDDDCGAGDWGLYQEAHRLGDVFRLAASLRGAGVGFGEAFGVCSPLRS